MKEKSKKKPNKWKRLIAVVCGFVLFALAVLGFLQLGAVYTGKTWKQWYPDYEQENIRPLLTKESLTEEDYDFLYRQTGLTKLAIDDMRFTGIGRAKILEIQQVFFKEHTVKSRWFAPFTYMDEIEDRSEFCTLQDGDIIVSATTRVSWWRYGHACIVVDGQRRMIAESLGPGEKSDTSGVAVCDQYADFLVLRPKVDKETKAKVVNYIQEEMIGLPYKYSVGIFSKKNPKKLKETQCAHFVWYAYKKFGIDLDGNGGGLVKPQDFAISEDVELVQAFGFDLEKLWK